MRPKNALVVRSLVVTFLLTMTLISLFLSQVGGQQLVLTEIGQLNTFETPLDI